MGQKSNKEGQRFIYALIDPRDSSVRYVGCAIDIDERLRQHMRSKNLGLPKYRWLAELKQSGLSPRLEILETVDGYLPTFAREEYWVKKLMGSGAPLTNVLLTREISLQRKKKATRPTSNRILRRRDAVVQELFSDEERETGLERIRKSLGLTEEGMAKRLTVSYSTYRNAEKGKLCRYATAMEILGAINGIRAERGMSPVSLEDLELNIQLRITRHKTEYFTRVSVILKEGASKVREGTHNEHLSKEVPHSSCTLLGIWLKPCLRGNS